MVATRRECKFFTFKKVYDLPGKNWNTFFQIILKFLNIMPHLICQWSGKEKKKKKKKATAKKNKKNKNQKQKQKQKKKQQQKKKKKQQKKKNIAKSIGIKSNEYDVYERISRC